MDRNRSTAEAVILSSPRMQKTATDIVALLNSWGGKFSHCNVIYTHFSDKEIKSQIEKTVRRQNVYYLQDLYEPDPNTALQMMHLTLDALKRASVQEITLVLPYIPYLRQDRKTEKRVSISARMLARQIESNTKVQHLITFDMHTPQIQGMFDIPVDDLPGNIIHAEDLRIKFNGDFSNLLLVAPDVGSADRTRRLAERLGHHIRIGIIDKRRTGPNTSEIVGYLGPTATDLDVVLVDDMVDTGGTILKAAKYMAAMGTRSEEIRVTHGLFSGNAETKFIEAGIRVVALPTIPRDTRYCAQHSAWLSFVDPTHLLARAIQESETPGGSVSQLSDYTLQPT